jgi:hypothetical protein
LLPNLRIQSQTILDQNHIGLKRHGDNIQSVSLSHWPDLLNDGIGDRPRSKPNLASDLSKTLSQKGVMSLC